MAQWSIGEARAWWDRQSWPCGVNYLPSSAVNFVEMWQRDSFDPETMERELGWAAQIGFNAVRVNLPFVIWEHDRDGLVERLDRMMDIASRKRLRCVPCPFDDCEFGGVAPKLGPQPDPIPGVHNGRAIASPGRDRVMDRKVWPKLEAYLRDLIRIFGTDDRILFWDLYNEPGNRMIFTADGFREFSPALEAASRDLMRRAFEWARAEAPEQPLTVGVWTVPAHHSTGPAFDSPIDRDAIVLSDLVSFHAYGSVSRIRGYVDELDGSKRPLVCTEWMARAVGSRIEDQIAFYRERKIGCFQWGLVRGRTQTHLPWPEALVRRYGGTPDAGIWFHDLLEPDGSAYDPIEIDTIRNATRGRTRTEEERPADGGSAVGG